MLDKFLKAKEGKGKGGRGEKGERTRGPLRRKNKGRITLINVLLIFPKTKGGRKGKERKLWHIRMVFPGEAKEMYTMRIYFQS